MLAAAEARLTAMTRSCESYEDMKTVFLSASSETNQGQGLWLVCLPTFLSPSHRSLSFSLFFSLSLSFSLSRSLSHSLALALSLSLSLFLPLSLPPFLLRSFSLSPLSHTRTYPPSLTRNVLCRTRSMESFPSVTVTAVPAQV